MIAIRSVSPSIDGNDIADDFLQKVYAGLIPITDAMRWVTELHHEGLSELAAEVSDRLPTCH